VPPALWILHSNIDSWRDPVDDSNTAGVASLMAVTGPHIVSLAEADEVWDT
jgi:hypothetical protein